VLTVSNEAGLNVEVPLTRGQCSHLARMFLDAYAADFWDQPRVGDPRQRTD
jgi:hypothetical protein